MTRAALKAKIAALRAKTVANGCTEAEAMAAAEMAARLMAVNGLGEADIVMDEAQDAEPTKRPTWRTKLSAVIAYCTNTASIVLMRSDDQVCLFVGRTPGPDIALYLRDVCFRAVDRELTVFRSGQFYRRRRTLRTRRRAAADFVDGMVTRLCIRLVELFEPMSSDALRDEAHAVLATRFGRTVAHRAPAREVRYSEAEHAGWRRGGEVALNRGVGETGPKGLLR